MIITKQAVITAQIQIPDEYCTFEYMMEDDEFCKLIQRNLDLVFKCKSLKVEPVDNANKL